MRDEEKTGVKEYFLYGSDIGSNKGYFSKQILLLLFNGGELSESLFPSIRELNKKETNRAVKKIVQESASSSTLYSLLANKLAGWYQPEHRVFSGDNVKTSYNNINDKDSKLLDYRGEMVVRAFLGLL